MSEQICRVLTILSTRAIFPKVVTKAKLELFTHAPVGVASIHFFSFVVEELMEHQNGTLKVNGLQLRSVLQSAYKRCLMEVSIGTDT